MRKEFINILNIKKFFNIVEINNNYVKYTLNEPSCILKNNIHISWLKSLNAKTFKNIPVYISKNKIENNKIPYGFLGETVPKYRGLFYHNLIESIHPEENPMQFSLILSEQESMQYFYQWQRYRKYWWSSITTTPALFSVSDMKHNDKHVTVNILAHFGNEQKIVETITLESTETNVKNACCLNCTMSLEDAVLILLLDGLTNSTQEDYLKLHRNIAPYKISFAVECKDENQKEILQDLVTLIHNNIKLKKISAILPELSSSLESQIKKNLQLGVLYTAIVNDNTLSNGIFHLLNSSTMLREQVHVAEIEDYAALLCGK